MSSKRIMQGSEEFMMFKEFWRIYQEYYEPEDNEGYWDKLVNDVSRFYTDFADIPVSYRIAGLLIDYFEEKSKSMK